MSNKRAKPKAYKCKGCNTELQGRAIYCVRCYRDRLSVCANCCVPHRGGASVLPRPLWLREAPICPVCNGEHWIIRD